MKTKGISFWEQNIERFVLGLAVLVAVVLVAMQFLGEPNAVQIGGKTITPGEVDRTLEEKAKEIDFQLGETAAVDVSKAADPVLPHFNARLEKPIVPSSTLAVWSPRLGVGGGPVTSSNRLFVTPKVPTPTDLATVQNFDTILPEIVANTEGLAAIIGANAPHDVTWATPSAKFDLAGLLRQYSEQGPNGEAALLVNWTNNRVDFIDIKVEREEYVDGQWTNLTLVDALPGFYSFRKDLSGSAPDDSFRMQALANASDPAIREQIIQPPFYGTMTESWAPPGGVAKGPAKAIAPDDPAAEQKEERDQIVRQLELVNAQLKKLGCPDTPPPPPEKPSKTPKPPKSGGGGGAGGDAPGGDVGAGAGGGGEMRDGTGKGGAADIGRCKGAWSRKKKLEIQLANLEKEIAKITGQAQAAPKVVEEVVDAPETVIDIWTHDLTIQAGKTYRYRFTVEVYNPLFGRKPALIAEQQPLADQFTIASEASEWSQPLTAQPPLRLFVTKAQPASNAGVGMAMGQAIAEVYRFRNGRWWFESFPVTPGDRVGDSKAARGGPNIDFGTDWFVLDVVPILGADSQDEKSGYGAMVMLQSLSDPTKIEWRMPRNDMGDPDRRRLSGRVKLADLGDDSLAASDGPRTGGNDNAN